MADSDAKAPDGWKREDVNLKGKLGTIPQWATALLMAVVAFFLSQTYKDWSARIAVLEVAKAESAKRIELLEVRYNVADAESRKRIELLELRYSLTDTERREAIRELKAANQEMVLELKAINSQLRKVTNGLAPGTRDNL